MTVEFVRELERKLSPNGVVALNIHSALKGDASKVLRSEVLTYSQVFPSVYVFPVGEDPYSVQTNILMASKKPRVSKSEFTDKAKILAGKIKIEGFLDYAGMYLEDPLPTDDVPVLTDDYAPVEALTASVVTNFYRFTYPVCFKKNLCVEVEVADTPDKRSKGLMYREKLGQDNGMLFIFPQTRTWSFWMKNTKIPLDMIWIKKDGTIADIKQNVQPCTADPCPAYTPQREALYVVEVNANYTLKHGIKAGDSADLRRVLRWF